MTCRFESGGKKISLLGYGAMRLPPLADGSVDQDELNRQVKYLLDGGVTYFDTSPVYFKGASETALGKALAASGYDRGSYVLATKLSNFAPIHWPLSECKLMFERSLKALQTDYIDNYLLHSVGNGGMATFEKRYLNNGAADWCLELRAARRIRNLGFSFHGDKKVFDWCLEHHDKYKWDFCMIQLNYVDWKHASGRNINAETLYNELTALKIPVVVMEPLLGGRLARYNWALANELKPLDSEASLAKWAFRFCGSHERVISILSGMSLRSHMEENLEIFSPFKMCTDAELAALERAAQAMLNLNTIPCNFCNYCMPCPYGLDIPNILTFRNQILSEKSKLSAAAILKRYRQLIPEELRRAEHCTGCARCNSHCPQMIDIPKEIAAIDAWIDDLKAEVVK